MSDLDAIAAAFDAPIVATQTLHIPVARDTFWKVFGDTARFARLVGEPTWQLSTIDEQEPLTILRGASLADPDHPIHVEIEPHQWVRGRFLAGPRRFRGLPLRSGVMQFALSAAGPQDTRVDVRGRGLEVYTPDTGAFRSHVLEQYAKSKFAAGWVPGMMDRINKL